MIILFLWADIIKRIRMGSLFFKFGILYMKKTTKKRGEKHD